MIYVLKYKPELFVETPIERAKISQWIEFACSEINNYNKSIIILFLVGAIFAKKNLNKIILK